MLCSDFWKAVARTPHVLVMLCERENTKIGALDECAARFLAALPSKVKAVHIRPWDMLNRGAKGGDTYRWIICWTHPDFDDTTRVLLGGSNLTVGEVFEEIDEACDGDGDGDGEFGLKMVYRISDVDVFANDGSSCKGIEVECFIPNGSPICA